MLSSRGTDLRQRANVELWFQWVTGRRMQWPVSFSYVSAYLTITFYWRSSNVERGQRRNSSKPGPHKLG
jgi:hypothetical protein